LRGRFVECLFGSRQLLLGSCHAFPRGRFASGDRIFFCCQRFFLADETGKHFNRVICECALALDVGCKLCQTPIEFFSAAFCARFFFVEFGVRKVEALQGGA
jgi:hypothetical protein